MVSYVLIFVNQCYSEEQRSVGELSNDSDVYLE